MIQRISLEHFKCFEQLDLPLAPLTLLTGLNASGKSTVIQALALLHQTLAESPASGGLLLNGDTISLGMADDVEDSLSGRGSFAIGIEQNKHRVVWHMQAEKSAMVAPITEIEYAPRTSRATRSTRLTPPGELRDLLPVTGLSTSQRSNITPTIQTLQKLTYISADRIGPRETYQVSSSEQQSGVGARGEYTPWFINQHEDLEIPALMCYGDGPPTLVRQVEAWLAAFFPGSGFQIEPLRRTSLLLMRLRASSATDYYRPANVGYGLSHILPVLTACLGAVGFAQKDQRTSPLVLVENPELHLHPAGQSQIGVFLARAVAAGAQVIIETHSDHVLNGIRRAVRGINNESPVLSAGQLAIHFFQARDTENEHLVSQVETPSIDQDGNIDRWPRGFFDQFERDLIELL